MKIRRPIWKKLFASVLTIFTIGAIFVTGTNIYIISSAKEKILTLTEAEKLTDADCIIVLGCGIIDNKPGLMLKDRLDRSIELYNQNSAPKLIMSGDHGQQGYDEVSVMKRYAVSEGIPSSDIFMDHAGFSTYESVYRAKEIFRAQKVIIVTRSQKV